MSGTLKPGGAAVYMLADEPEASAYMIIGDTVYPVDFQGKPLGVTIAERRR